MCVEFHQTKKGLSSAAASSMKLTVRLVTSSSMVCMRSRGQWACVLDTAIGIGGGSRLAAGGAVALPAGRADSRRFPAPPRH